jgi:predicted amidohydrolase YtcJ
VNTAGFRALGITRETTAFHGGKVVREANGSPILIVGADSYLTEAIAAPKLTHAQMLQELPKVLRKYNEVGITAIGERRSDVESYRTLLELEKLGRLPVRATVSIYLPERTPERIEKFVHRIGVKPGDGDDWVKVGGFKIAADGGIHWGTTALREPYGPKRIAFYRLTDAKYRGDLFNSDQELLAIYQTAYRLGWQVSAHATGDRAVAQVLDAIEAVDRKGSVRDRRFTLIHAYFPAADLIARARRLNLCVDTQPYLYYKDSDAMAEVYGKSWADRFIGLGDWIRAGIHTAINSDHMIGLEPDHAMNSYNPFLAMYIAVSRKNQNGTTYNAEQRISRIAALRAMTSDAAYMDFEEKKIGSIEPGKLADFAVLDKDYLLCPEEEIRAIKVLMTMIDGRVVYERK